MAKASSRGGVGSYDSRSSEDADERELEKVHDDGKSLSNDDVRFCAGC